MAVTFTTKQIGDEKITITRETVKRPGGASVERPFWDTTAPGAGNLVVKGDETTLADNFATHAVFYPGNAGQARFLTPVADQPGQDAGDRLSPKLKAAIDQWAHENEIVYTIASQFALEFNDTIRNALLRPENLPPELRDLTPEAQKYLVAALFRESSYAPGSLEDRIELGRDLVGRANAARKAAKDNDAELAYARALAFAAVDATMDGYDNEALRSMIEKHLHRGDPDGFGLLLGSSAELELERNEYPVVGLVLARLTQDLAARHPAQGSPAAQFLDQVHQKYSPKVSIEGGVPLKT
jgi:hypothetical protein